MPSLKAALVAAALLVCAACGKRVEHPVKMSGMTFAPASLTVHAGDDVVFTNDDLVPHTATAPGRFDSGPLAPGASYRVTLRKPGPLAYGCTLHPMMKATILVE